MAGSVGSGVLTRLDRRSGTTANEGTGDAPAGICVSILSSSNVSVPAVAVTEVEDSSSSSSSSDSSSSDSSSSDSATLDLIVV